MKSYSIAEARETLPTLVKTVEAGAPVEITKRGHAVAVVVPVQQYEQFSGKKKASFWDAMEDFRKQVSIENALEPGDFDNLRDKGKPQNLVEFIRNSPLYGVALDLERDKDSGRFSY